MDLVCLVISDWAVLLEDQSQVAALEGWVPAYASAQIPHFLTLRGARCVRSEKESGNLPCLLARGQHGSAWDNAPGIAHLQFLAVLTGTTTRELFQAAGVNANNILDSMVDLPERLELLYWSIPHRSDLLQIWLSKQIVCENFLLQYQVVKCPFHEIFGTWTIIRLSLDQSYYVESPNSLQQMFIANLFHHFKDS